MNDPGSIYFVNAEKSASIYTGWAKSQTLEIDKKGEYYISIGLDKPGKVLIYFGEQTYSFFLFPEDTTVVNIKYSDIGYDISFSGLTNNINRYYVEKKIKFKYEDTNTGFDLIRYSNSDLKDIIKKIDSLANEELAFLDHYKSKSRLSRNFQDYEQAEIIYSALHYKITFRNYNSRDSDFSGIADKAYFDFLKTAEINNDKALFSDSYFKFLDEFMKYKYPIEDDRDKKWRGRLRARTSNYLKNAEHELSGPVLDLYKLKKFSGFIAYLSDPHEIDSIIQQYNIVNYRPLMNMAGTRDDEGRNVNRLKPGKIIPEIFVSDDSYNLVSLRDYKDKQVCIKFYNNLNDSLMIIELKKDLSNFQGIEQIAYLNICVGCDVEEWKRYIATYPSKG
ncbi:MAG: hypothetical protein KAQ62_21340, partial [Cyclobacteriaceae bacterium]|nr:hypothetical protein [Cyclobacteriaceae bacterium]